jgi:hypothetical protein
MSSLILKRASASRPSDEWEDDDYDVLADGACCDRTRGRAMTPACADMDCRGGGGGHHRGRAPSSRTASRLR